MNAVMAGRTLNQIAVTRAAAAAAAEAESAPPSDDEGAADAFETPNCANCPDVPYSNPLIRDVIDHAAFEIYGRWVRKGDHQNRAVMFETKPKNVALRVQSRKAIPAPPTPLRLSPEISSPSFLAPLPHL